MANETRVKGRWHLMRIDDNCKLTDLELRQFMKELNKLTRFWEYEINFFIDEKQKDFLIEGDFNAIGCDSFVDNLEWLTSYDDDDNLELYDKYKGNTNFIIFFQYDEFDDAMGTFNKEAVSSLIFHNRNIAPVLGSGYYIVEPVVKELVKSDIINSKYFDNSIIEKIFYEKHGQPYQTNLDKLDEEDKHLAILFKLLDLTEEKDTPEDFRKYILNKVSYGQVYDLETGRQFVRNEDNRKWLDKFENLYRVIVDYENKKSSAMIAKLEMLAMFNNIKEVYENE